MDDASAPVVKFQNFQACGGRPPVVKNRPATNTLVVEGCDLKVLGNGGGDIFVTDCPAGVELRSPGQRLRARQLNPEGDSDLGLVQNHGGVLWALGVKHEGRGVRFLTDNGGQTEIFCREGYIGAEGALTHLANVRELLEQGLQYADLTRLELYGPADELEMLKGPLGALNPLWFESIEGVKG